MKELKNVRLQTKRDTSANWTTNNPVLLNGEIILVDTADGELRAKVGDGVKTYTQLPFSDETLRALVNSGGSSIYIGEEVPNGRQDVWIDTNDSATPDNTNIYGNHATLTNLSIPNQHPAEAISYSNSNSVMSLASVKDALDELFEKYRYPIGSIYMSTVPTDPSTLFGGEWDKIEDVFLLASSDKHYAGETGGKETHTLTIEEIPSHNHNFTTVTKALGSGSVYSRFATIGTQGATTVTNIIEYAGNGAPHNNMPPYLSVYMWKRRA